MSKASAERALASFRVAQTAWADALAGHRLAPPDAGFSGRLEALASASSAEAEACRQAHEAGFTWPPHRASSAEPPYELRPGTGRRGPEELWRPFDVAVSELNRAASGTDLLEVAEAYEGLAAAAAGLAEAVGREDRTSREGKRRRRRAA
jgi:hypothetical protein